MKDNQHKKAPGSLLWLQGMQALTVVTMAAVWVLIVPTLISLPAEVTGRIRGYVFYLLPLVLLIALITQLFLGPVVRQWHRVCALELGSHGADRYLRRMMAYPYHAFMVTMIGCLVTTGLVSYFQARAYNTPTWVVMELMVLALALGVIAASLMFFVARKGVSVFLREPGMKLPKVRWDLDVRKSITLASMSVALVTWAIAGVLVFDHQHHLALSLGLVADSSQVTLLPAVVDTALWLAIGGALFVLAVGLVAYLSARDLTVEPGGLASRLDSLAHATEDALRLAGRSVAELESAEPATRQLAVLGVDEMGELAAAYNRLAQSMAAGEMSLRQEARHAEQAEMMQTDFLNTVNSDLREPLKEIIDWSGLLLAGEKGQVCENHREDVDAILRGANHLQALVDDLMDLTRIETGHMTLAREEMDLAQEIRLTLAECGPLCGGRPVELQVHIPDKLPVIRADRRRIRQILFNLIGNAIKFTDQGLVRVLAHELESDRVTVTVEDSGPGIPEHSLGRVFGEFEQVVVGQGKKAARGTGLGLTITKHLVELHGGQIEVSNRPEGGSAFVFSLPTLPDGEG